MFYVNENVYSKPDGPLKTAEDDAVRVKCADAQYRTVRASLLVNSSTYFEKILSSSGGTSKNLFKIEVPIKSAVFDLLVSYFSSDRIVLHSCLEAVQLYAVARTLELMKLTKITEVFLEETFVAFVQTGSFDELSDSEMLHMQNLPFLADLEYDRQLFAEKIRSAQDSKRLPKDADVCGGVGGTAGKLQRRSSELSTSFTSSWMSSESSSETSVAVLTEDNGKLRLFRIHDTFSKEYSCKLSPSFKPSSPSDAVIVRDRLFFVDKKNSQLRSVCLRTGGAIETIAKTPMNISYMTFFGDRLYVSIVDEVFVLQNNQLQQVGKSAEYILEFAVLHHSETEFQFIHRDVSLRLHWLTCERPNEITKASKSFQTDWLIGTSGSQVFTISSKTPKELMVIQNFQRVSGLQIGDKIGRNSVLSRGRVFSCVTQPTETIVSVLDVNKKSDRKISIEGRHPVLLLKASNKFKYS